MLEAKQSLKHIHYKNERTMPYASFVANLTGIFQVLSDGGREKGETEKIELFFEKFQCKFLKNDIIACKFDFHRNGGTFANNANVMADHVQPVSQSQQFGCNRNVSVMCTTHTSTAPSAGIYLKDGTIFTGKYERENFQLLSREEMGSLKNARSRHSSAKTKGGKRKIKATKRKSELTFKKLKKDLKESRRTISALQAPTAPRVAYTPKGTPAPAVSGAGTKMTLYAARTQMGGSSAVVNESSGPLVSGSG